MSARFFALRRARRDKKLPVILVHENDEADGRDGCEFAHFFGTTPSDLIDGGLYGTIAVAFMPGHAHRRVSYALCAKALGAGKESKGRLGRLGARVRRSSLLELSTWAETSTVADEEEGGRRLAYMVESPMLDGVTGGYFSGKPGYYPFEATTPSKEARSEQTGRRLWELT